MTRYECREKSHNGEESQERGERRDVDYDVVKLESPKFAISKLASVRVVSVQR